jgi:hypothetical protein
VYGCENWVGYVQGRDSEIFQRRVENYVTQVSRERAHNVAIFGSSVYHVT